MRLPIDMSRLKFMVVADVEPSRQFGERKPSDVVSVSSDWAGRSAVGGVTWRAGRGQLSAAA